MGKLANGALSVGSFGLLGSNPVSKALGLSGDQGEYMQAHQANPAMDQLNANNAKISGAGHTGRLDNYRKGLASSDQALEGMDAAQQNDFATNATTGSKYATEQVQNNPILGKIFGAGGQQDKDLAYQNQAQGKEQELQNQGFKLNENDQEAYGQQAGNIGRMFGQSENKLSQSLASRGLSAGASGAAGAQFSGLSGNKNEMLAKSMTDIADARMNNTMKRIGQQQQFVSQLRNANNQTTAIGAGAIDDQYKRQLAGSNSYNDNLQKSAGLATNNNQANNQSSLMELEDKRGAKGKTLLEGLGSGLMSSASSIGAAPGKMVSSAAGKMGSSLGGGFMGGGG